MNHPGLDAVIKRQQSPNPSAFFKRFEKLGSGGGNNNNTNPGAIRPPMPPTSSPFDPLMSNGGPNVGGNGAGRGHSRGNHNNMGMNQQSQQSTPTGFHPTGGRFPDPRDVFPNEFMNTTPGSFATGGGNSGGMSYDRYPSQQQPYSNPCHNKPYHNGNYQGYYNHHQHHPHKYQSGGGRGYPNHHQNNYHHNNNNNMYYPRNQDRYSPMYDSNGFDPTSTIDNQRFDSYFDDLPGTRPPMSNFPDLPDSFTAEFSKLNLDKYSMNDSSLSTTSNTLTSSQSFQLDDMTNVMTSHTMTGGNNNHTTTTSIISSSSSSCTSAEDGVLSVAPSSKAISPTQTTTDPSIDVLDERKAFVTNLLTEKPFFDDVATLVDGFHLEE
jgi:hypothetical protein